MSDIALRNALVAEDENWRSIGREATGLTFDRGVGLRWWIAFAVALALIGLMAFCVGYLLYEGVGIWGNNVPVTWALDIVSYDWWIGIATGGLLLSGLLLLFRAEWRGAVNRVTETMALGAAAAAALYPIIHLGRPWFFYWNLPYPNTFLLWPQVRSPLYWDAIDIVSFLGVCLCFWYVGMLPDLAAMRDRALEKALARFERERMRDEEAELRLFSAKAYGVLALGWRGSAVHWHRWFQAYRTMALFALLVVISLQTGAAVMFAGTVEPGWHDTLLPFAFIAASVFSGIGVTAVLAVVLSGVFGLGRLVTPRHLELLAMLLLGLGLLNLYCYAAEFLTTWLNGTGYDHAVLLRRFVGTHAWSTWCVAILALLPVHLFWVPALRRSGIALALVGLAVAAGSFADHFMVIVTTLQNDFLPSAAQEYSVGIWGLATFAGSMGLFLAMLLLFVRTLPAVSIVGIRRLVAGGELPLHG
jgi:Ni/Fe-hydrogenase subunit HybB-like protein